MLYDFPRSSVIKNSAERWDSKRQRCLMYQKHVKRRHDQRRAVKKERQPKLPFFFGGDKRDRTADLLTASQALSQLSYTPEPEHSLV